MREYAMRHNVVATTNNCCGASHKDEKNAVLRKRCALCRPNHDDEREKMQDIARRALWQHGGGLDSQQGTVLLVRDAPHQLRGVLER
jgi:hypothetical protein